jgi:hypothetical protein
MTADILALPAPEAVSPAEYTAHAFLNALDDLEALDVAALRHLRINGFGLAVYLHEAENRLHRLRRLVMNSPR